jgi:hypothetical protein
MLTSARRRLAALRQPGPSARLARALWIVWAVVVWNVVFDRVIVVAGRSYIVAATRATAADPAASPLNMDDWMQPAVRRALVVATAAAGVVLATGLAAVAVASRRQLRIRNVESGIREPVEGQSHGVETSARMPNSLKS